MSWFNEPCTLGGVALSGGFLLESGPFGHSGASIAACMAAGFAAVSTETISLTDGKSPWWNIYRVGESLYNCSKWSDLPFKQWKEQEIPYALEHGGVIIATVGHTAQDVQEIVPALDGSGIAAVKVCTYHAHEIVDMVRTARRLTRLPVWAKISANWPNFLELALACQEAGADALVAIDTLGPVAYPSDGTRPALGSADGLGWMSGAGIHGKALYVIAQLKTQVAIPVVGVGGIMDADSVRRARAAGADAIGLCSTVLIHGLDHLSAIKADLHTRPDLYCVTDEMYHGPVSLHVDWRLCNHCGRCVKSCGYLALHMENGTLQVNESVCRRCGLCQQHCAAITLTHCDSV